MPAFPPPIPWRRRVALLAMLCVAPVLPAQRAPFQSPLTLSSNDTALVNAFRWARDQASAYAFDDDPVGPWFEAALPGREAFCMRDVAHQVTGAHALGMQRHVHNMLRRFAGEIRESRDWASLWEIDRHGRPAHADYRTDRDFWYNLPANFDVLDAAWRMYLWSGNQAYVSDSTFLQFYDHTVTSYVTRWRLDPADVMARQRIMNRGLTKDPDAKFADARGIPGYNEEDDDFTVGLDLLAAEYAGFAAYARVQEARGDLSLARRWLQRAGEVRTLVNTRWWDGTSQTFHDYLSTAGALRHRRSTAWNSAALYWPVATEAHAAGAFRALTTQIRASRSAPIEEQSHHPEVLYRYGAADLAYDQILDLTRESRARREYPEVSFSVIGAIVTGTMGVSVDPVAPGREGELVPYFGEQVVATLPQPGADSTWVQLEHLPVRGNHVAVRHQGRTATVLRNESGPALVWRAMLPGTHARLFVNGVATPATAVVLPLGRAASAVRVVVPPGTSMRVGVAP